MYIITNLRKKAMCIMTKNFFDEISIELEKKINQNAIVDMDGIRIFLKNNYGFYKKDTLNFIRWYMENGQNESLRKFLQDALKA